MKITVIFASPNKDKNTAKLLNDFLGGLKKYAESLGKFEGEVSIYHAYDLNVKPCIACGICHQNEGECVFHDMDELKKSILASDLLIIATPIYNYSFPAPLKAVIDRLECYFDKDNIFNSEQIKSDSCKVVLLATAGSSGKYSFDIVEKQVKMACMMLKSNYIGSLTVALTDVPDSQKCEWSKVDVLYREIME